MPTSYLSWGEAVALFERRGLPESTYRNLYDEEYILVPGPATVGGTLSLSDHEHTPWGTGETAERATGYVVDGDLTIDGNLIDEDDGAQALIVLGRLRVGDVFFGCDPKLLVLGDLDARTFGGTMTDKLVMVHGDLRATVTVLDDEFVPDLVTGTVRTRLVAPSYIELERVEDPTPGRPLADLVVAEVLREDGTDIDIDAWRERIERDEPVLR
ncbi:hypothetical protein ACFFX1_48050 [Dactylosporangium sucinum]|uniref:hypothetical protein n=1 Tax=Dactylosporangium sucinum TaxID=1424081 RepID=UPI00167D4A40|nr:hypothetical protein [Dactylosporangium sucinum]